MTTIELETENELCVPSPTNPGRRTRADIEAICEAMHTMLKAENPMTVRQLFYRLVSAGVIAKTETEYKRTVCRLLGRLRLDGVIPFGWIADNTRWMRKPRTHSNLAGLLEDSMRTYRRALWDNQGCYVEVWLEKDALAGVLMEETAKWDVPLMVTRGYASLSYLYEAAEQIKRVGRPAYLFYFGDYDPSGMDITRSVETRIREFAPRAEIHFERVAVTPFQIRVWNLPTRPTKTTDVRSRNFEGAASVEVDAIPPDQLRALVQIAIEKHIDHGALERMREAEAAERRTLRTITTLFGKQ